MPTEQELIEALGGDLSVWAHNCHAASLTLVKSGVFDGPCRVARGRCDSVFGQHSWVVLGKDCYFPGAKIVDPTLWSYDDNVKGIWTGKLRDGRHAPHGMGNIFDFGKPPEPVGDVIALDAKWSRDAKVFLAMCGPLDYMGWSFLAHCPVQGWPAGEIYEVMQADTRLRALIPIDRLGMLTDLNPNGLYLP